MHPAPGRWEEPFMNELGLVDGRHYTTYVEDVRTLKRANQLDAAHFAELVSPSPGKSSKRLGRCAVVLQTAGNHLREDS